MRYLILLALGLSGCVQDDIEVVKLTKHTSLHTSSITSVALDEINFLTIFKDLARESIPAVVKISAQMPTYGVDFNGKEIWRDITGTGFLLDNKYLLTNEHLTKDSRNLVVEFYNSVKVRPEVIFENRGMDIGILYIPEEQRPLHIKAMLNNIKKLKINPNKQTTGEWIIAIGHPVGLEYTFSVGHIANPSRIDILYPFPILHITAPIGSGSSGSPIINLHGEVVGILSSALFTVHIANAGYAVPMYEVHRTIKEKINEHNKKILSL